MAEARVIPCLLVRGGGLYKTVRFDKPRYVGDPVNVARIFNDKEVDELVVLDIGATPDGRPPPLDLVRDLASECFMPLCYGGGVRSLDDFDTLFAAGIEKVSVNTAAVEHPALVREAADAFGSQSIVVSIDIRRGRRGRAVVCTHGGRTDTGLDPVEHAVAMEQAGAGEVLLTSVDREGTGDGYDVDLVGRVAAAVDLPVIANGGAGGLEHFAEALGAGAAGVAAGSMFVFHGRHRAVLISYPTSAERARIVA